MKKSWVLFLLTCLLFIISCEEAYKSNLPAPVLSPKYISLSSNNITINSEGDGSSSFLVKSLGTTWKIDNSADWLSFNPSHLSRNDFSSDFEIVERAVTPLATENSIGYVARTSVAYLRQGSEEQNFTYEEAIAITQQGATPYINVSNSQIVFTASASSQTIEIQSNCTDIRVEVKKNDLWLKAKLIGNNLEISTDYNYGEANRMSTVYLRAYDANKIVKETEIKVIQEQPNIVASTQSIEFENYASSVTISVNSPTPWTISTAESWIQLDGSYGEQGDSDFTISVSPNTAIADRMGSVIIYVSEIERIRIPVRQRGIYIDLDNEKLEFTSSEDSKKVNIRSNTSWEITKVPDWITVSQTEGGGNAEIIVSVSENPKTGSRSGSITVCQEGLNITTTLFIFQAGKFFETSETVIRFDDKEGSQTVDVKSDGSWVVSVESDWLSVSPTSGEGNGTLTISVTENNSSIERSAVVNFFLNDSKYTLNVVQLSKYLIVDNENLTYPSKGGDIALSISANDSWVASIKGKNSWLAISETRGSGDANITLSASDNPSVNSRSAILLFETSHKNYVRILVTQQPRYLTLNTQSLFFYAKGGTSESIIVDTDGEYSVSKSSSWLSITQSSNSITVTAEENPEEQPRFGTITFALSDLVEGSYEIELSVTQLNDSGSFFRFGFDGNEDWTNNGDNGNANFDIDPYGGDDNWNSESGMYITDFSFKITNYVTDEDWNNKGSGLTINRTGFKDEKNLDPFNPSNGDVNRSKYGNDKDLDKE